MKRSKTGFVPQIRIGNGPWINVAHICKTKTEGESVAAMCAKWWLGVAEARVIAAQAKA
jgi:hypothetical protein